jgi:gluconate 2-dehydrogenase gamma chain
MSAEPDSQQPETVPQQPSASAGGMSRTRFLRVAGVAVASVGVAGVAGCGGATEPQSTELSQDIDARQFPPLPPAQAPALCTVFHFFDAGEARTVDAMTARFIPGTTEDPGASQACVVTFIDQKLASFHSFATKTYFHPPFAKALNAGNPGPQPGATKTIFVAKKQLGRYGFQSSLTPQEAYRKGIAQLDRFARARYGAEFADLDEANQDAVLEALETSNPDVSSSVRKAADMKDPEKAIAKAKAKKQAELQTPEQKLLAKLFVKPTAYGFFSMVLKDTYEGMFADPVYGGNRNLVGWAMIGYPGAQRGYTPWEVQNKPRPRRVQGLLQLHPEHPGDPQAHVVLPISGTRETAPKNGVELPVTHLKGGS